MSGGRLLTRPAKRFSFWPKPEGVELETGSTVTIVPSSKGIGRSRTTTPSFTFPGYFICAKVPPLIYGGNWFSRVPFGARKGLS